MIQRVDEVPSADGKPSSSPGSLYPPAGFAPLVRPPIMLLWSMASESSLAAQMSVLQRYSEYNRRAMADDEEGCAYPKSHQNQLWQGQ